MLTFYNLCGKRRNDMPLYDPTEHSYYVSYDNPLVEGGKIEMWPDAIPRKSTKPGEKPRTTRVMMMKFTAKDNPRETKTILMPLTPGMINNIVNTATSWNENEENRRQERHRDWMAKQSATSDDPLKIHPEDE